MTILLGALATIFAAVIVGVVTITSTVIAKEQKISELRQLWINSFKNDMAKFLSLCINYRSVIHKADCDPKIPKEKPTYEKALIDLPLNIQNFYEYDTRLKLHLNGTEHIEILLTMEKITQWRERHQKTGGNGQELESLLDSLLKDSGDIISIETAKSKDIGKARKGLLYSSKLFMMALLVGLVFFTLYSHAINYCPFVG